MITSLTVSSIETDQIFQAIGGVLRDALYVTLMGREYGELELKIWQCSSPITPKTSNVYEKWS